MNRVFLFIILFFEFIPVTHGQVSVDQIKTFKQRLSSASHDRVRARLALGLAYGYRFSNIDSSLVYTDLAIDIARRLKSKLLEAKILSLKGATLLEAGRLPESLGYQFEALRLAEELNDKNIRGFALNGIGNIYMELGDYRKANEYYWESSKFFKKIGDVGMYHNELSNIGNIYELLQIPDSALYFQNLAYESSLLTDNRINYTRPEIMFRMGNAYKLNGDLVKAMEFYKKGIIEAGIDNDIRNLAMNNLFLARLFYENGMIDSAINYSHHAIQAGNIVSFRKVLHDASILLSDIHRNGKNYDSAYQYLIKANIEKDSLTGTRKFQQLERIILDEQERLRKDTARRIAAENRQKQYALSVGVFVFLIVATILYRNNKHKQRTNRELEKTLQNLKSTQSLLVQSEKMASLGELTAGIAHEIQNPLNFVNNFSAVSKELLEEMMSEIDQGNNDSVKLLAGDVIQNLDKIEHHGKRADSIVKGMLQHSRSGSGLPEPTDINQMTDEYLRLAFHGFRSKDNSFTASMKTDYDDKVGFADVVKQDIGRVVLNLFTNAFYAVNEKKKSGIGNFDPNVSVKTQNTGAYIIITIADNGNGIPANILEKIFQPFFTTKPTGQGTGLGLSLSYDIMKAHGGELNVHSNPGQGSEFIITIPTGKK